MDVDIIFSYRKCVCICSRVSAHKVGHMYGLGSDQSVSLICDNYSCLVCSQVTWQIEVGVYLLSNSLISPKVSIFVLQNSADRTHEKWK